MFTRVTKDSGEREEYDSGMQRDTQRGKPRFDLLFPVGVPFSQQMITRFADLMERGATKYGARNWEKGNSRIEYDRAIASAMRHLIQWVTDEDDEDHAAGVFFNIMQAETLRLKMDNESYEEWHGESIVPKPGVLINKGTGTIVQDTGNVGRCFEPCPEHLMLKCHKEKGHSFRHAHDNHWYGPANDDGGSSIKMEND